MEVDERTEGLSQKHRPVFRNGGGMYMEDEEGEEDGARAPAPPRLSASQPSGDLSDEIVLSQRPQRAASSSSGASSGNAARGEAAAAVAAADVAVDAAAASGTGAPDRPSRSARAGGSTHTAAGSSRQHAVDDAPAAPGSPSVDPVTGLRPRECGHSPAAPVPAPAPRLDAFPYSSAEPLDEWEWRPLAATGEAPTARWGHCATVLGDGLFIFGGDGDGAADGSGALNDLYRLDLPSSEWRRCMDAPHRRAWHSGVAAGGSGGSDILLVFGGEAASDKGKKKVYLGSMWSYDPEFEVWYEATDRGHRPSARGGHTACVHTANGRGLKMLVFGGVARGDRYLEPEVHELHIGADWSWRKALTAGGAPAQRAYHTCTRLAAGRVLVFGGNDGSRSFEQPHLLELASMTWSSPPATGEPPTPRTGHVAVCLDGHRVLIHGGWDPQQGSDEPEIWDDVCILDTRTWSWARPRVRGAPPAPRTGHSLLPAGGALYLYGGLGERDVLADAHVLAPLAGGA